jgi:hypothetical protein
VNRRGESGALDLGTRGGLNGSGSKPEPGVSLNEVVDKGDGVEVFIEGKREICFHPASCRQGTAELATCPAVHRSNIYKTT